MGLTHDSKCERSLKTWGGGVIRTVITCLNFKKTVHIASDHLTQFASWSSRGCIWEALSVEVFWVLQHTVDGKVTNKDKAVYFEQSSWRTPQLQQSAGSPVSFWPNIKCSTMSDWQYCGAQLYILNIFFSGQSTSLSDILHLKKVTFDWLKLHYKMG